MPVTCVARAFYAEFDDVKGPVVLYEEPPGCLTRDEEGRRIWECFGDYVITGREPLDGVAVRARAGRDAVLCVPQILRSETRYVRNAFSSGWAWRCRARTSRRPRGPACRRCSASRDP